MTKHEIFMRLFPKADPAMPESEAEKALDENHIAYEPKED